MRAAEQEFLTRTPGTGAPAYKAFKAAIDAQFDFASQTMPSPGEVRDLCREYLTDEVEARLRDYEHYETTGQLSHPTLLDGAGKKR